MLPIPEVTPPRIGGMMTDPCNYVIGDRFHYDSGIFIVDTSAKDDKFRNQNYLPLVGLISDFFL